uniref:WD repeat-containing protein 19 n=1 Tax=Palpitomonas bilix TaxID=652834 RepID=A0A7S3LUV7_9EUKA|mmetsp:Transcript_47572/g.123205  ORF Transcript_47572/g.123205 Transcript_47572/m.123205 type:complete len:1354 (+) Transcript_47572:99-4160(+)
MKQIFSVTQRQHGPGIPLFAWNCESSFLATCGENGIVYILDRRGDAVDDIGLDNGSGIAALEWDSEGNYLAVVQNGSSKLIIWSAFDRKKTVVDTQMTGHCAGKWSKTSPIICIGTIKGNILIYNHATTRKIPVMGKHTKRISAISWSNDNKIALGSEDRQISISNADGDGIMSTGVKYEPVEMQFVSSRTGVDSVVSINTGRKTLLLVDLNDSSDPIELAFPGKYGNIACYDHFGDGYVLVGFSNGYINVISIREDERGNELFQRRMFDDTVAGIMYSAQLNRAAIVGESRLRVLERSGDTWDEVADDSFSFNGNITHDVAWTDDGSLLTVSMVDGTVHTFLAKLPILNDANDTRVVTLTSLREFSISDVVMTDDHPVKVEVDTEPAFVSLGPSHLALGMNNIASYYHVEGRRPARLLFKKEYTGSITTVKLNRDYAAVLCQGRVQVHPLDANTSMESTVFPEKEGEVDVTCIATTPEFLIYGTKKGVVAFVSLADMAMVNEYKHECGIKKVFPNPAGTRMVFIDETSAGFIYNPVNDHKIPVPDFRSTTEKIMWDSADWGVFVALDKGTNERMILTTYVYSPMSLHGPTINAIGHTKMSHAMSPIVAFNGLITVQLSNGALTNTVLTTHDALGSAGKLSSEKLARSFKQNVLLKRFKDAWDLACTLNSNTYWKELSMSALDALDVPLALRVSRQLKDPALVLALQQIQKVEDKNVLAGHIALLTGKYDQAQELFLSGSAPLAALEMRKDLMQWEQAMRLAQTLSPESIPLISRQYASQLEFQGDYVAALDMYERGLSQVNSLLDDPVATPAERDPEKHIAECRAGLARNTLRLGDIKRGIRLVNESGNINLYRDCAAILEGMKQWSDAAALYERCKAYDKAVSLYLQTKNYNAAEALIEHITSPKLLSQFARAREAQKQYKEAEKAYERAKDMDSVVRLNLEKLSRPEKAFPIVRQTRSLEGAKLVAAFCKERGDFRGAVEFLLIAKDSSGAFECAQSHDLMDVYAEGVGTDGTTEQFQAIAQYYEAQGQYGKAGDFFAKCGHESRALRYYLQSGEAMLDKAIDLVGRVRKDALTQTLIDALMGESDGMPKDPKYIFRLYLALGNYVQAAKTAVIIARQEQELGNYKVAHSILFDMHQDLVKQQTKIPDDLLSTLRLLHSYILVKVHVKKSDHKGAAKMLTRVSKSISRFPAHIVPILTSTVIECQRAGYKKSALEFATMLMRPEYRPHINASYKKKIEVVVRRPDRSEEPEETSPCPFCASDLPQTALECDSCKSKIPYCAISGKHMVASDWSQCPRCSFPCLHSEILSHVAAGMGCPMCGCTADAMKEGIQKIADWKATLKRPEEKKEE